LRQGGPYGRRARSRSRSHVFHTLSAECSERERALLWQVWQGGPTVRCDLCAHRCRIRPGETGLCGVRRNDDGVLYTLTYGCAVAAAVDPIEKKPLYHFLPGSLSFSIAAAGCNFTCSFCQNSDISQMPRDRGLIRGSRFDPDDVVARALETRCASIAYTYTEPTIYFEYARDCAVRASRVGLKNVFVTNGYMTGEALDVIGADLHAANVDLKSFDDGFYRRYVGGRLRPVLDSIARLHAMGVWVEVTTLLIPGLNDSEDGLRRLAGFLAGVDPDLPWHVSRFQPTYRMLDRPATPAETVERAVELGREEGLRFVYAGNLPSDAHGSTRCPTCGETVIERRGFHVTRMHLDAGRCRSCHGDVAGVFATAATSLGDDGKDPTN
jgi:pyruvate formate lyase activating enzyme